MGSEFREGEMQQALRVIDIPEPRLGLELPTDLSFEQWEAEGRRLSKANHALQWYIGDWWNAGEKFGEERRAETAKRFFGLEYQRVRDIGWVAGKFDLSCRHDNLSFTHHQEAAALDEHEAARVLTKAEQENWSVKDVRYVVQKLKTSNDTEPATVVGLDVPSKSVPAESWRAMALSQAHAVIELAEGITSRGGQLTRRESDLLAAAEQIAADASEGHRSCPSDFDIVFVEKGRLTCETYYEASRLTVNRWLIERGKSRLINQRAEYVRFRRDQDRQRMQAEAQLEQSIDDTLFAIAREAAQFLRTNRYGGWIITSTTDGQWIVGTVRKTSDELIAMAERQGFDSEAARKELDAE